MPSLTPGGQKERVPHDSGETHGMAEVQRHIDAHDQGKPRTGDHLIYWADHLP